MVNHLLEVLLQGVWSSFTGGWYYDPNATLLTNTIHMYIWLILFSLPMSLYLIFEASLLLGSIYSLIIGLSFLIVKLILLKLNRIFKKTASEPNENDAQERQQLSSGSNTDRYETRNASQKRKSSMKSAPVQDKAHDETSNNLSFSENESEIDTDEQHYSSIEKYEKIEMTESLSSGTAISQEETLNESSKLKKGSKKTKKVLENSNQITANDYEEFFSYRPTATTTTTTTTTASATGSSSINEILIDDRSLFKISEESLDESISCIGVTIDSNDAVPIANTHSIPSFEETSVSDTKLFNKNAKICKKATKEQLKQHQEQQQQRSVINRVRRTSSSSDLVINNDSRKPFLDAENAPQTSHNNTDTPQTQFSKSFNYLFPSSQRIDINNNLNDELKEALEFLFNESSPASFEPAKTSPNSFQNAPTPTQPSIPPVPPLPAHRLRRQHPVAKKRSIRFESPSVSSLDSSEQANITQHNLDEIVVLESASENRPVRLAKRRRKLSKSIDTSAKKRSHALKIHMCGSIEMRLSLTRYELASMFDLSDSMAQSLLHVSLAILVCICASCIMSTPIYGHSELCMVLFAASVASCHYSLLKSVQPESSAQVHSFSQISPINRSLYFIMLSIACLGLNYITSRNDNILIANFLSIEFNLIALVRLIQACCETVLIAMPFMFILGLFAQIDTFAFALIEQIDMHIFGSSASASLSHATASLAKSLLSCLLLTLYHYYLSPSSSPVYSIAFISLLTVVSYLNSRQSSAYWSHVRLNYSKVPEIADNPICTSIGAHICHRVKNDAISLLIISLLTIIGLVLAPEITINAPNLIPFTYVACIVISVLNNYMLPSLRSEYPWLIFSKPFLKCDSWSKFEVNALARVKWFERIHVIINAIILKNGLNVALIALLTIHCLNAPIILIVTSSSLSIVNVLNSTLTCIFAFKLMRASFCQPGHQYQIFTLALISHQTTQMHQLATLYALSIVVKKLSDTLNKISFVFIYTAPWQLPWGSAFHAFAQPLAVPHSALLVIQSVLSSLIGAPLMSLLGSSIFLVSYMRPIKFWPSSKPINKAGASLSLQNASKTPNEIAQFSFENNENLNAIFYEHLCTVLQKSLCGDLMLGRWGNVTADDFFILSSDYLNCMVHVIEMGNGFCTFQLRGLEFKGTYCQQRELEAITEDLIGVNLETTCSCCAFQSNSSSARVLCTSCYNDRLNEPQLSDNRDNRGSSPVVSMMNRSSRSTQTRITRTSRLMALMRRCGSCLPSLRQFFVCMCCCCCVALRHYFKFVLSLQNAFQLRWYAWRLVTKKYIVNSYRICDNDLSLIVNFYSLRRTLIDFYVRAAVFYAIRSNELPKWIADENIMRFIGETYGRERVDLDKCFDANLDMDFDYSCKGISYVKFCASYLKWIQECVARRKLLNSAEEPINDSQESNLVNFLFALSLACRRALLTACNYGKLAGMGVSHSISSTVPTTATANSSSSSSSSSTSSSSSSSANSQHASSSGVNMDHESLSAFQHGLFTLFKGDVQIQSPKDDWIFINNIDSEILSLITSAIRMAVRLHQDHFQFDHTDEKTLFESVEKYVQESVIAHEHEPAWRRSILANVPSLLSLRHQFTEFSDQYKVIMLNRNFLSFRVIKLNKECVKSFWAGQQHELIFLKNKNQERGSIQNAKQVLRNIINSSCDQPIGYPIYVSPLITSYASTHHQLVDIVGGEMSFDKLTKCFREFFKNFKMSLRSKGSACSSANENIANNGVGGARENDTTLSTNVARDDSARACSSSNIELRKIGSSNSSITKRRSLDRINIIDVSQVVVDFEDFDERLDEELRKELCSKLWNDWKPQIGMEGEVVMRVGDLVIAHIESMFLVAIKESGVVAALQHECTSL